MTAIPEGRAARPPSRGRLVAILAGGFAAASVITVCAILPAEFHIDPTGLGAAAGLMSLSAAPPARDVPAAASAAGAAPVAAARESSVPFRTDVIEIPLKPAEETGSELEYKVRMKAGQTLVYSWSVNAPAEEFYVDFHSEERPSPKENVVSHKSGLAVSGAGALTAPFDGIHGWYLQNQSLKPVTVKLRLSGFYELLPDGRPPA